MRIEITIGDARKWTLAGICSVQNVSPRPVLQDVPDSRVRHTPLPRSANRSSRPRRKPLPATARPTPQIQQGDSFIPDGFRRSCTRPARGVFCRARLQPTGSPSKPRLEPETLIRIASPLFHLLPFQTTRINVLGNSNDSTQCPVHARPRLPATRYSGKISVPSWSTHDGLLISSLLSEPRMARTLFR